MTFRYVVRCAVLVAAALVAAGCSSGALPTPVPAGSHDPAQGPSAAHGSAASLTASGTVTVKSGGKVVCVMTIKNGKGTCNVSLKNYKPGSLTFTGDYSGGGGLKASVSKPLSVHVLPSPKAS